MTFSGALLFFLWLQGQPQSDDLMLNWILIGILLVIAAILGIIVIKRRSRERDDEL
ncbi:MAG TPA: hypothetical protein VFD58_04795 [Blastocatellia bacterium]|nr:hypothetical protein [Blastocatellia bacterium]